MTRRPTLNRVTVLLLCITLWSCALTQGTWAGLASTEPYMITVLDQFGDPTPDAVITIRDRSTQVIFSQQHTNAGGWTVLQLDRTIWYICSVSYRDQGTEEFWSYGYVKPEYWAAGAYRTIRRGEPWLEEVIVPQSPVEVGQPQDFQASIAHGYPAMNYDLKVRIRYWVDDDGEAPYLWEGLSDTQVFYNGLFPFHMAYMPSSAGLYRLRFQVEGKFEGNAWYVADEGGWSWLLNVSAGMPTPTPTVTVSPTPRGCSISGRVFEDVDRDDQYDPGEDLPIAAAQVVVSDSGGRFVQQQTTDSQGHFAFSALGVQDYRVRLGVLPPGYWPRGMLFRIACAEGASHDQLSFGLWTWRARLPLVFKFF